MFVPWRVQKPKLFRHLHLLRRKQSCNLPCVRLAWPTIEKQQKCTCPDDNVFSPAPLWLHKRIERWRVGVIYLLHTDLTRWEQNLLFSFWISVNFASNKERNPGASGNQAWYYKNNFMQWDRKEWFQRRFSSSAHLHFWDPASQWIFYKDYS